MYNEKICQRLRAKIDSSLFPDQENGKYRVFFQKDPTKKSSKYGIGPSQQDKITKLLRQAEHVVDDINNHKQGMVKRAVRKMKDKAQACVAVEGGVFEGRKL